MDLSRSLDEAVAESVRREDAWLESWLERSLTDPLGRGIRVDVYTSTIESGAEPFSYSMNETRTPRLDEGVPSGRFHEHRHEPGKLPEK